MKKKKSINRKYNLENHGMEKFGLPFLLSVPHSLTWKELHMKIFEIVKRHLDFVFKLNNFMLIFLFRII